MSWTTYRRTTPAAPPHGCARCRWCPQDTLRNRKPRAFHSVPHPKERLRHLFRPPLFRNTQRRRNHYRHRHPKDEEILLGNVLKDQERALQGIRTKESGFENHHTNSKEAVHRRQPKTPPRTQAGHHQRAF